MSKLDEYVHSAVIKKLNETMTRISELRESKTSGPRLLRRLEQAQREHHFCVVLIQTAKHMMKVDEQLIKDLEDKEEHSK